MYTKFNPIDTKTGRKSFHEVSFLDWAKTIENNTVEPYHSLKERIKQL